MSSDHDLDEIERRILKASTREALEFKSQISLYNNAVKNNSSKRDKMELICLESMERIKAYQPKVGEGKPLTFPEIKLYFETKYPGSPILDMIKLKVPALKRRIDTLKAKIARENDVKQKSSAEPSRRPPKQKTTTRRGPTAEEYQARQDAKKAEAQAKAKATSEEAARKRESEKKAREKAREAAKRTAARQKAKREAEANKNQEGTKTSTKRGAGRDAQADRRAAQERVRARQAEEAERKAAAAKLREERERKADAFKTSQRENARKARERNTRSNAGAEDPTAKAQERGRAAWEKERSKREAKQAQMTSHERAKEYDRQRRAAFAAKKHVNLAGNLEDESRDDVPRTASGRRVWGREVSEPFPHQDISSDQARESVVDGFQLPDGERGESVTDEGSISRNDSGVFDMSRGEFDSEPERTASGRRVWGRSNELTPQTHEDFITFFGDEIDHITEQAEIDAQIAEFEGELSDKDPGKKQEKANKKERGKLNIPSSHTEKQKVFDGISDEDSKTGYHRLTPKEKAAVEKWAANLPKASRETLNELGSVLSGAAHSSPQGNRKAEKRKRATESPERPTTIKRQKNSDKRGI